MVLHHINTKAWLIAIAAVFFLIGATSSSVNAQFKSKIILDDEPAGGPPPAGGLPAALPESFPDEDDRGTTVLSRERPETDALGVRMLGFEFFPKISTTETFNDNIFLVESAKISDFITVVRPELEIKSNFGSHEINLFADADIGRYIDNSAEDYNDYHGGASGKYDITEDSYAYLGLDTFGLHEGRGSVDDVGGTNPTKYFRSSGVLQVFAKLNRLAFTVDAVQTITKYNNTPAGTTVINNKDRDHEKTEASFKVSYELQEEVQPFMRVSWIGLSYDDDFDDAGFNRDSRGYRAVVGTTLDFGGITFGDVFAGYRYQDYDPALTNINAVILGAAMTWNPTRLTTVTGNFTNSVEETTQGNASGFVATDVGVNVDHELLRSLLLNGYVGVTNNAFKGIARESDTYRMGLGAKWFVNRYGSLSGGWDYTQKETSTPIVGADADYKNHTANLRIQIQL